MKSKFTQVFKVGHNAYAVYNTITGKFVFLNTHELNDLNCNRESELEHLQILRNYGIIVDDYEKDEHAFNVLKKAVVDHSKKVRIMYLILTTNCNLACKYCFVDNNPINTGCRSFMNEETCNCAINKFLDETQDAIDESQIIFYGGEPLVNKHLLVKAIELIRSREKEIKVTILTNGTLLTKEDCLYFKEKNVGIGLSLDGPKRINDKNRIFKHSKDSVYDVVKKNIKILNETQCPYCVSATVTKEVLRNKKSVLKNFKNMNVKNVFWNLFHFSAKEKGAKKFYKRMTKFILKSYKVFNKFDIKEGRILEHINLFAENVFKFQSCGAVGLNQITVQPNGDVCICQGDQRSDVNVSGNINKQSIKEILDNKKNDKWLGLYTVNRDECKNCSALFVCGGGCPLQSLALNGDQCALDKVSCEFYKELMPWLMKQYYKQYLKEVAK